MKPFSEAAAQNREPILQVLREIFADRGRVLEIGSGTGQHAVYFARALPHLTWQTSDQEDAHAGIQAWIDVDASPNVLPPLRLKIAADPWPDRAFDAVFSANTVHIMGWPEVENMFRGIGRVLQSGGIFALYGPFHYGGKPTSESNARFDAMLRARDPNSGVRDLEDLDALAQRAGMSLSCDYEMPVNNRILVWRKG